MSKYDSSPRQAAYDQFKLAELSEQQLDHVAGGTIHVTTDQATPNLYKQCCNGKHFPSA
jgi:type VI protein secretion system component Hcp